MNTLAVARRARGLAGDPGRRRRRLPDLAHHERLLRRLPRRRPGAERLGHQRRVPLRGVVPRRRRPGAAPGRRHALVPGRLDRRLPAAARLRRRAAAPVAGLHAARLRGVPRRVAAGATGGQRAGRADRAALPGAAVPGSRAHPARADRVADLGGRDGGGARRARQRRLRRDAQHHHRPGLPVLAQAGRPAHPADLPAPPLAGHRSRARQPRLARTGSSRCRGRTPPTSSTR